MQQIITTVRQM